MARAIIDPTSAITGMKITVISTSKHRSAQRGATSARPAAGLATTTTSYRPLTANDHSLSADQPAVPPAPTPVPADQRPEHITCAGRYVADITHMDRFSRDPATRAGWRPRCAGQASRCEA